MLPAQSRLDDNALAMAIMAMNNEVGIIQDIRRLSQIARGHGAAFHCDAAQAPLAMPMESFATRADILSLSNRKMYGPKGVGIVFIARNLQDRIEL